MADTDCLLLISVPRHPRRRTAANGEGAGERENERKNIILTANPIIPLMYVC